MTVDRRLRLSVVIDDLAIGGAQLLLPGLAAGAEDAGIELFVTYLHDRTDAAPALREQGVEPALVPVSGLLSRSDHRRVRDHLAGLGPDLVHTHIGAADVVGGRAARSLRIPTVSTVHSTHWSGRSLPDSVKLRLQVGARRRCARIVTVSESVRIEYLTRGWGRPEQVVSVHNGIIDRSGDADGKAVREELGLAPDDIVVTMVGALARDKGQSIMAAAARELASRFPGMRVLIVGDGPLRSQIAAEIEKLGDHAAMIGHRDDVTSVLAATDILVHPTQVDALPTVLIEAMSAAVPIVVTEIGGVPEMIQDGVHGVLMEAPPNPQGLARALEPLLRSGDLRRRLGEAGRRRFEEHFTIERWFARLAPVYGEAMAPGARP